MTFRNTANRIHPYPSRLLEDVDYWRKRAGWYDDDESMKDYNSGVYNSYYSIDDDLATGTQDSTANNNKYEMLAAIAQILAALIGLAAFIMLIRAVTRGSKTKSRSRSSHRDLPVSRSKSKTRSVSRSRGSGRSRSKSRTRSSRSLSRSRRSVNESQVCSSADYELMGEKGTLSKPRRSRSRSKSKSRGRSSRSKSASRREPMLV